MFFNNSSRQLRLLVTNSTPGVFSNCKVFPVFDASLYCPFPGWIMEITNQIARYTNTTIVPVVATGAELAFGVGSKVNGSWNGYLGEIQNGDVDTVTSFYQYTSKRGVDFEYSYPVYNLKIIYVTRQQQRQLSDFMWNVFEPYSTLVWIMLLVGLLVQSSYGSFIRYLEFKHKMVSEYHPLAKLWQYFRLHVLQGDDTVPFETYAGNFTFLFFVVFQVLFFTELYQARLLSALFQEVSLDPFGTADEAARLIKKGDLKVVTFKVQYDTFWFYNDLEIADGRYYATLRDALKSNPLLIKETLKEALDLVNKGGHIYITQEDGLGSMDIKGLCNVEIFSNGLPEKSGHYLFNPGNPLIKTWNEAIYLNDAFIRRTYFKYFKSGFALVPVPRCTPLTSYRSEAERPLDFKSVFGIFFLYFICLTGSIVGLAAEIYVNFHLRVSRRFRKGL